MNPMFRFIQQQPNRVRVYPPESVTTISEHEVDPRDVGVSPEDVDAIWAAVVTYYKMGLQPSMSLCIRRSGKVLLNRTIGHARGNAPGEEGEPELATPATLYNMFSASKCITSMLIHLLDDRGQVHIDDPIEEYIPGFGQNGKNHITIRHILTHRAGIPLTPPEQATLDNLAEPGRIVDLICQARPTSGAGRRQAYHALSSGFILAAVLEAVTGRGVRDFLREEVCEPLGFKHLLFGVSESDLPNVAVEAFTGPTPRNIGAQLLRRSIGLDISQAVDLSNDRRFLTGVVPSGNIIGTADEVCRFFELLLRFGELDGVRVFSHRTVRRAVAEYRSSELDGVILLPVRFGLGFMLGSDLLSPYGRHTARAFGHLGFTNVLSWADPERDLSIAFMNNGKPFVCPELVAWMRVMWTIAARIPRDYGGKPADSAWLP
jgi:CubicO group peptidase (beta-lactamase class C family)